MKLTKATLKQFIKEEIKRLQENDDWFDPYRSWEEIPPGPQKDQMKQHHYNKVDRQHDEIINYALENIIGKTDPSEYEKLIAEEFVERIY